MVVSWDDRQGEINTWIEGLNQVVSRVSDNQLDSLDRLLEGHSTMLAPLLDGSFETLHRESLKKPIFFVTAVFTGDEACGKSWAWPFSKKAGFAFHLPNAIGFSAMNSAGRVVKEVRCGLIILRGNSVVTPLWKGLCFAHELLHRQNAFKYPTDLMSTRRVTGVEESDVHSFIHRLMVLLGGETYKEVLRERMDYFVREARRIGKRPGEAFLMRTDLFPHVLDQVFGPSLSEEEETLRQLELNFHAAFTVIDRFFQGNKSLQKAELMQKVHENALD